MPDLVVSINGAPVEVLFGNSELARAYTVEARAARDTARLLANAPPGTTIPGEDPAVRSAFHFAALAEQDAVRASAMNGFALRSELLAVTVVSQDDRSNVFDDPGVHAAVDGEVALGGGAAVVGENIPNTGEYQWDDVAGWRRIGDRDSQIAEARADEAEAAAARAESITQSHVIDFADAADGTVMLAANFTSPSTRYSSAVDANGYLDITAIQASNLIAGWRSKASPKIGRSFNVVAVPGTPSFNTTIGPCIGFDTARTTGANAQGDASARYIVWRSNAVVQVQNGNGANQTATEGYTVTTLSGTIPSFVAGDVLTMTLLVEDEAGTKRARLTLQKGTSIAVVRVSPLPEGFVFAGFNLLGNATEASRQTGKIRSFGWADATVLTENIEQNVSQLIQLTGAVNVAPQWRSPVRYALGSETALLPRVVPTPLVGKFPVVPVAVHGPGHVDLNRDAITAFLDENPGVLTAGIAYVSPNGSDLTGAVNDPTKPYATINTALRSTTARLIVLEPNPNYYAPWDFRASHSPGGAFSKLMVARIPGTARLGIAGTDISTLTWTDAGSGAWQCTYPAGPGGIHIHRVVNRLVLDRDGFPSRAKRRTSLATVQAETRAYWADTATRTLYVKWDGIDIEANKAAFQAYWMDAAGNSRTFQQSSVLAYQGLIIDGLEHVIAGTGTTRSRLFADTSLSLFSPNYGANDLGHAGHFIATRYRLHASFADGVNLNNSATYGESLTVVADSYFTESGDFAGQVASPTENRQAISSHSGACGLFGNVFERSLGQEIADTSNAPGDSASWIAGCLVRDDTGRIASKVGIGIYGDAAGADRAAWIDTCAAPGIAFPLELTQGATAKVYDSDGLLPATVSTGSVQPTAYTPGTP